MAVVIIKKADEIYGKLSEDNENSWARRWAFLLI
jgi:hypothetical protein